ncbi:TonB-dependent receptor [Desertivirga xinjiangensis]|uniref:TonB-dependent receptor n=1 Tax=Desertivirga xinjiangensis TaxID=539206 RepID=UPI00210A4B00|nr:TonB-dependent receptor [Pedobacter xinjiangensis]
MNRKVKFTFFKRSPIWLFCFCFLVSQTAKAQQQRSTVSGIIKDASTGETLIGASVRLIEIDKAASSNSYGFYSLSAPNGEYSLQISYIGYQTLTKKISLAGKLTLNLELASSNQLQEVVISSKSSNELMNSPQMGLEKLNMEGVKNIPVLLGERDVLKTIQLLPGIKSAGEGNSGFYVRGGSSDHNLILLDEANVYNASHLLGFFSTFNSDAIKDVAVYKGGMPAQYGGRLASVLDIKMNDGNSKEYTAEGGIGLISSRLKVEGPLIKDKGSFMLSGRRTYADMFLKLSSDTVLNGSALYFYDVNAKANYEINDRNTMYLSGYFGQDKLGLNKTFYFNWGNTTATLRWNHIFNSKIFSNTSLIYSDYNYAIENLQSGNDFRVTSIIRDWNLKQDFQYFTTGHTLRFGLNANHHRIEPGKISSSQTSEVNERTISTRNGLELAAYISDEWRVSDVVSLNYGLRLSSFALLGPGTIKSYDQDGNTIASRSYDKSQIIKHYFYPEPRFAINYRLAEQSALKASVTRNTQNLHLLSNSSASLPTDLWIMSSNNVKPQVADQAALGYYLNFNKDKFEFSAEVYYKNMRNQIDYKNAANLRANENVEAELLFGKGRAYGIELFLKKKYGDFNGWIGYTLSRTERSFDGIDNGTYFPAKQDRTHDLSLVAIYKAGKRWTLSGTFVYNTGNAVSFPHGKYQLEDRTEYYYGERNRDRMPDYHRLDLGATLEGKPGKRFTSSWTFGLYNAYNRHNAYTIEFEDVPGDATRTQAVQTALFGIIPSVTWNFKL